LLTAILEYGEQLPVLDRAYVHQSCLLVQSFVGVCLDASRGIPCQGHKSIKSWAAFMAEMANGFPKRRSSYPILAY